MQPRGLRDSPAEPAVPLAEPAAPPLAPEAAAAVALQRQRPPPAGIYRSPAGEAAIRGLYASALAALPHEHEERTVPTSHGAAHVTVCGRPDAPALVVWHGMGGPAPYVLRMLAPLARRFCIYAPDLPYHSGSRSKDAVLDPHTHEHGKWALEVLQALGLVPPRHAGADDGGSTAPQPPPLAPLHVGVSFGGAVLIDVAQVAPDAIRGAALIVPAGLLPVKRLSLLLRVMLPSLLYQALPCDWTTRLALSGLVEELEDPEHYRYIPLMWRHVSRHPKLPGGYGGFTCEQLACLIAPTIAICAQHDVFWDGPAAAAAAAAALPDCEARVIPGALHLPAPHKVQLLNEWILEFFERRGLVDRAG
eukprot:scaffold2.g7447.t1